MSRRSAKEKGKFISKDSESRYHECTINRPFCWERGFQLGPRGDEGLPHTVTDVIQRRNWFQFTSHPSTAHKNWIREFYANFPTNEEQNWVIVRKQAVGFDAESINSAYGLTNEEDAYTEYISTLTPEDWGNIMKRMCKPGTQWRCSTKGALAVNKTTLRDEVKVWYHFLISRLMPSTHGQTINGERLALLDTIISTRPLNVGKIIEQQMKQCAAKRKGCLFFPALITKLCADSGVPNQAGEARTQLGGALTPYAISRIMRNVGEVEIHEAPQEAAAPPDFQHPYGPIFQEHRRLARRVTELEDNRDADAQQQLRFWMSQQQQNASYQRELQRMTHHHINFPHFPVEFFEEPVQEQNEEEGHVNVEEEQELKPGMNSGDDQPIQPTPDSDSSDDVYIDESRTVEGNPEITRRLAQAAAVARRRSGLRSASRFMG